MNENKTLSEVLCSCEKYCLGKLFLFMAQNALKKPDKMIVWFFFFLWFLFSR